MIIPHALRQTASLFDLCDLPDPGGASAVAQPLPGQAVPPLRPPARPPAAQDGGDEEPPGRAALGAPEAARQDAATQALDGALNAGLGEQVSGRSNERSSGRPSERWNAPAAAPAPPPPAMHPGLAAEDLHPALWRAHQLARPGSSVLPSHYPALDAALPGGGWPARVLTELLLPHPGVGELRLLAPVLAGLQQQQRSLMWFDPPAAPCAWALGAFGIDVRQLVVVRSRAALKGRARELLPAADVLWALEQALKSGHLGAVLAWLPARLPADALRRLQLAAQAHDGPVFLLRDAPPRLRQPGAAFHQPSAAPLRLLLNAAGADRLRVDILKRRGPPLAGPVLLDLPGVLSAPALVRAQSLSRGPRRGAAAARSPSAASHPSRSSSGAPP